MRPLVIYHGACRDGFASAWVVRKRFPDADFIEGFYGQNPPDVAGRDVILVDFSYKRPVLMVMAAVAKTLLILDHHKTAQEDLAGFEHMAGFEHVKVVFDMNRSGAGIAWDYFFDGHPRPWMINYVEDRDLWRFALPSSKALTAWLGIQPFEFEAWDLCEQVKNLNDLIQEGGAVLEKTKQYCTEVSKNARLVHFEGYAVPCVNAPQVDISELLNKLATQEPSPPFAIGWFQTSDGMFKYSLRSRGDFDVSALAKKRGGGGHKNAAGFESRELIL